MSDESQNIIPPEETPKVNEEENNNNNFKNLVADYLKGQRAKDGNGMDMGTKPSDFNALNKKKTTKQRVTGLASLGNNSVQRMKQAKRYGRARNSRA